jgi:hypothetical protein
VSDLVTKRGDTIELHVGPVLKGDQTVQNITGHTIRFTAKAKLDDVDGAAVISGSTADSRIVITDGPGGLFEVRIPPAATSGFTADRTLHWDLQISDPAGTVRTLDFGKLLVTRDVTRT